MIDFILSLVKFSRVHSSGSGNGMPGRAMCRSCARLNSVEVSPNQPQYWLRPVYTLTKSTPGRCTLFPSESTAHDMSNELSSSYSLG